MINKVAEYTKEEIVEIIKMKRLELYNRGQHCSAKAIKNSMEQENIEPVPSESSIGRILSLHGLTHGRTGFCDQMTFCQFIMGASPQTPGV